VLPPFISERQMSTSRVIVLVGLAAALVAACTSPSSPADAASRSKTRAERTSLGHPRSFSVLTACVDNTVEISPCNTTISAAKNASNDSITMHYTNHGSKNYGFDAVCGWDGTVVLSCTPTDTLFNIPAFHSLAVKYHFSTRATAGTGTLSYTIENVNTGDGTGSNITVTTH
jgi:hypothetical protein